MFWILLIAAAALLLVYLMIVRPILKNQPALSPMFKAEASFWDKVQAKITGWRTKIATRLVGIGGLLVAAYDQLLPLVSGQDWTPITAKLPGWVLPVAIVALAWLFERLRNMTENPPQLVVQKDEAGVPKVVDLIKPAG